MIWTALPLHSFPYLVSTIRLLTLISRLLHFQSANSVLVCVHPNWLSFHYYISSSFFFLLALANFFPPSLFLTISVHFFLSTSARFFPTGPPHFVTISWYCYITTVPILGRFRRMGRATQWWWWVTAEIKF